MLPSITNTTKVGFTATATCHVPKLSVQHRQNVSELYDLPFPDFKTASAFQRAELSSRHKYMQAFVEFGWLIAGLQFILMEDVM